MPRRLLVFLISLVLAAAEGWAVGQSLSSAADLAALYSLRSSLGLRARDWPRKADPCSAWAGVGCAAGRVVSLDLAGLRRTRLGRMDPRFAVDGLQNLTRLVAFNASGFPLPGPIPGWFGARLPGSLSVLALPRASVAGPIPYSLGSAAGLAVLDLSGNSITGSIPPTLGQLGNLSSLDISGNQLTGSVPSSFATLGNLSYLDLSSNLLTGAVPPALGTLPKLKTLILADNSLTGTVPPQLGDLALLVKLDLSFNYLVGNLPADLKNLRSLQELDLGNNSLTGSLPGNLFTGLSGLLSVTLSRNNFSGALPDSLWSLPELQFIDASYNNLTGVLPDLVPANASANASGSAFNLSNNLYYGAIPSGFLNLLSRFSVVDLSGNYFQGMVPIDFGSGGDVSLRSNCFPNVSNQRSLIDCREFYTERGLPYDVPGTPRAPPPSSPSHKKSDWSFKYILIGVFAGIAFLVFLVLVVVLCLMRRGANAAEQRASNGNGIPSGAEAPVSGVSVNLSAVGDSFTYEKLLRATADFNDTNLIKHGHSGDLYRGVLEDGIPVVVKRIDVRVVKRQAHVVELDLFAKASHARLVPFLGHYLEDENEKFLVYKYMPNGDLSNALYRKPGLEEEGLQSLDWITRLKIATGVAEALCFLHHECTPPMVHRDVQASSILLDDKFDVRLGSLSEVCSQESDVHQNVITRFLRLSSQASDQSATSGGSSPATCAYDVYCLGKVLLELVTGKLGISGSSDASTIEWLERTLLYINIYEKELVTKIVDPSLIVDEDLLEEVWAMAIVAKSCLNPKPSKRPLVRYILKALENPLKVVREENSSGSGRLRATSSRGSWNAALFGSWRQSSSDNIVSAAAPPRDDRTLKRSGTMRSQGSGGEHSFSHRKPPREIFPEPPGGRDGED